jgi:hypothetical protein
MGSIARHDVISFKLVLLALVRETDRGAVFVDATNLARLGLEQDWRTGLEASLDQVLDHFLLAVDKDAPACQLLEIDTVALAAESQMNPAVFETFTVEPFPDAGISQELRRPGFEDACAHAALVWSRLRFSKTILSTPERCSK